MNGRGCCTSDEVAQFRSQLVVAALRFLTCDLQGN
jgi:hypothetical protein